MPSLEMVDKRAHRAVLSESRMVNLQRLLAPVGLVSTVVGEAAGEPVRLIGHRFQNPCDGMRSARLKREDAFSHAMIIVSSAMVSSS